MSKQHTVIVNANILLDVALDKGVSIDEGISRLGLDDKSMAALRGSLQENTAAGFDGKIFVGGTGQLRESTDLSAEEAGAALACLKGTGRLFQIGKGRGRALAVTNNKHLTQADWNALLVSGTVNDVEAETASTSTSTRGAASAGPSAGTGLEARIADLETQVQSLLEAMRGVRNATSL